VPRRTSRVLRKKGKNSQRKFSWTECDDGHHSPVWKENLSTSVAKGKGRRKMNSGLPNHSEGTWGGGGGKEKLHLIWTVRGGKTSGVESTREDGVGMMLFRVVKRRNDKKKTEADQADQRMISTPMRRSNPSASHLGRRGTPEK